MSRPVEEIGLDHEDGPQFAGFCSETRIEIGHLELVENLKCLPHLLLVAGEGAFPLLKPVATK